MKKETLTILILVLGLFFYSNFTCAKQNATHWKIENVSAWQGYKQPRSGENNYGEWATYDLPTNEIKKRWINVTSQSDAKGPDVDIWISLAGNDGKPFFRTLPSNCEVKSGLKECSNQAWVSEDASAVKVNFFWPKGISKNNREVKFYSATNTHYSPTNVQRYKKLIAEIKKNYYRKAEVNWHSVYRAGYQALNSPTDIDPIPRAILQVMSMLPDASHMSFISFQSASNPENSLPEYPTCKNIGNSIWVLNLPETNYSVWNPWSNDNSSLYVSSAHKCLHTSGVKKWIINLTNNSGGNADLMFSALYPIFGESALVVYKGFPEDQHLTAKKGQLLNNGKVVNKWSHEVGTYSGNVEFVIGEDCASSCEAIAVAAKGRFTLLGQPTRGLTTSNMVIKLSEKVSMTLTHALITHLSGVYSQKISPDQLLSKDQIQEFLKNGIVSE